MMKMRKWIVIGTVAILGLASCSEEKFQVKGSITNAKDSVLYFENVGISEISILDSVKLDENGSFTFAGARSEAPEFYRLRISDQIINVSIDSTETITVKATYPQMATQYDVSGSENCLKIKELALKQIALQQQAIAITKNENLTVSQTNDSIVDIVNKYKDEVKNKYILPAPQKAYAYFALFQAIGDMLIFNPRTNRDDIKMFAAVATSWDTFYPNSERVANLHNIALEGLKNVRIADANNAQTIDSDKIRTAGLIDIELKDNKGMTRRLTDLKGQVVLLDFHVFATQDSPARILMLRELYNKYHAQGFEIYQVSLDPDEHFWKQQTTALPWVSVRDEEGPASANIRIYNVQELPEYFLIDRGNNIIGRSDAFKDLEQAIMNLL